MTAPGEIRRVWGRVPVTVRTTMRRSPRAVSATLSAALILLGSAAMAATGGDRALVLTQSPAGTSGQPSATGVGQAQRALPAEGSRVVVVEEGRVTRVLSQGLVSAADPEVSPDGAKILFAGKRSAEERWAIFEVNADGTGLRKVIASEDDLRSPVYLPVVYTLVADPNKGTEPREQIGYVRVFRHLLDEAGQGSPSSIFSCTLDGSSPRRLTLNLSSDLDTAVLGDGRVLFARSQRATLERGFEGRVALATVNADGTDPALFTADEGMAFKRMPCVTTDRLVVFVESERPGVTGTLGSVSLRCSLHSYRRVTDAEDGQFAWPSALSDGGLLAAHRPASGSGSFGIVRIGPVTGKVEAVFDDPAYDDVQPRPLAPRPATDQRSSAIRDADGAARPPQPALEGKLYALNVYLNDLGMELPPGTFRMLRVLEGVASPRASHAPLPVLLDPPVSGASLLGLPPLAQRRLLGEAAVEEDGSFQIVVPADIPLQLQLLDADGLALSRSGWIWVHNQGQQGCVGCHEDGELSPSNRFVTALTHPAPMLNPPPEKRRSVDFRRDLMPVVERRCMACHGPTAAIRLDDGAGEPHIWPVFNRAYQTLLSGLATRPDGSVAGRFVHPGQARTSPLIWHLYGRNMSRPWDGEAVAGKAAPPVPDLTAEERRVLVEWVDLGALWAGGDVEGMEP